jgi:carbonic anhydrase/acetyltransferase-like protein (isoleucine patch superfamily)
MACFYQAGLLESGAVLFCHNYGNFMTIRTYLQYVPAIAEGVFVDDTALVIGRVALATDVSVWPLTTIRGDVHDISVGARTNVQDGSVLHTTSPDSFPPEGFPLIIGEDVTIGHRAILHGCTIGDRVLIGMGSIVMDGAVIEADVILGGGSVVSPGKVLASGGLYVGSPAKRIRDLRPEELEFLRYSANHYVKLKNLHQSSPQALD